MTVAVGCPLRTDQCVPTPSFSDSCFEKNSVVVILQREGEMFTSSCWKIFLFSFILPPKPGAVDLQKWSSDSLPAASSLWRVCLDFYCNVDSDNFWKYIAWPIWSKSNVIGRICSVFTILLNDSDQMEHPLRCETVFFLILVRIKWSKLWDVKGIWAEREESNSWPGVICEFALSLSPFYSYLEYSYSKLLSSSLHSWEMCLWQAWLLLVTWIFRLGGFQVVPSVLCW